MIGLLDFGGAGLVAAALGEQRRDVHVLPDLQRATRALAVRLIDALIVECPQPLPELDDLLFAARAEGIPVLVVGRERNVSAAVQLLRAGAHDYVVAPFEYESLLEAIGRLQAACAAPASRESARAFVTGDPDLLATLDLVRSVAATDATVLIEGESGTGKELLARMVHQASARAKRELVSLNCAALPPGLLESELFGHERGAFTGAFQRVLGKFELADGSTLLLDEIGELELGLQAKLLRVVQEKQVQRIGAPRPHPVDFRLVATTNRDLAAMVRRGAFREDLYYRLNVVPVRVRPLRERRGDVRRLVERFLERRAGRGPLPQLPPETLAALEQHRWPGNVREVENLIERLTITHAGRSVRPLDLPFLAPPAPLGGAEPAAAHPPHVSVAAAALPAGAWLGQASGGALPHAGLEPDAGGSPTGASAPADAGSDPLPFRTLREMERWLIVRTLAGLQGNRTRAARELGISLRTLRNKIHEYRIAEPETLPRTGTPRPSRTRQGLAGQELPPSPGRSGADVR